MLSRVLAWLDGPRGSLRVVGVAMLLCLPALAAPFFSDDWMQARKLAPDFYGEPFPLGGTGLSELFVFATGEPADTLAAWRN